MTDREVRRSSRVIVAEFVATVGEGNKFTKLDLNRAIPFYAQNDRRMRELRESGWVIDNYKVNPSLAPDEDLVREIGVQIDLGERPPKPARGAKRRRILERDGHVCAICGAPAGKPFPDAPSRRAVLTIGHLIPIARGGTDDDNNLRTVCQRCGDESRDNTLDPPTTDFVLTRARNIRSRKERKRLFAWMVACRKSPDDAELVFLDWRRLPHSEQVRVMQESGKEALAGD